MFRARQTRNTPNAGQEPDPGQLDTSTEKRCVKRRTGFREMKTKGLKDQGKEGGRERKTSPKNKNSDAQSLSQPPLKKCTKGVPWGFFPKKSQKEKNQKQTSP